MDKTLFSACGLALLLACAAAQAAKPISETRAADPHAVIEINGVSGRMEVTGWDKPSVDVTGTVGNDVDRVEISGDSNHVAVQVVTRSGRLWAMDGSAQLTVHVPAAATVSTTLVSADFHTSGVTGDLEVHTVSGNATGEVGGNLRAKTVSGDVRLKARAAKSLRVSTVSGDIEATGGDGESEITTVSGTTKITLGLQSRAHFKSVSGDITATLGLTSDGQLNSEAVSGDMSVTLRGAAAADFDLETHSGTIHNCFGPKPAEPHHGPGSRLMFKNGDGNARVHIVTHSGDVSICKSE
jgi:hypothetical protein